MNKIKVKCNCGATLELDYDDRNSVISKSMFDKFLKMHNSCLINDEGDPLAADPDWLERLDVDL